jgi:hypothetical protein
LARVYNGTPVIGQSSTQGIAFSGSGSFFVDGTTNFAAITATGFYNRATSFFGWSSGEPDTDSVDLVLARDTNNVLAQRNGVNAQTFRLYNTYTDASNYERSVLNWSGNELFIGTQSAGTGGNRNVQFVRNNTTIISFSNTALTVHTGGILFNADNTLDIGASGGTRPRSVYAGTSITPGAGVVVASLPTPSTGMIARVTDATLPVIGATVAGGGAAYALVNYNGANWTVIGV